MNMMELQKSRRAPRAGDVFVYQLRQMPERLYFGRVFRTDARIGGFENVVLIYLYNAFSDSPSKVPPLSRDSLLVPPIGTNRLAWVRGYFQTVQHGELRKEDVLPVHGFKDPFTGGIFDDNGQRIDGFRGITGFFGLDSFQTIDEAVSKALGLPLSD